MRYSFKIFLLGVASAILMLPAYGPAFGAVVSQPISGWIMADRTESVAKLPVQTAPIHVAQAYSSDKDDAEYDWSEPAKAPDVPGKDFSDWSEWYSDPWSRYPYYYRGYGYPVFYWYKYKHKK